MSDSCCRHLTHTSTAVATVAAAELQHFNISKTALRTKNPTTAQKSLTKTTERAEQL
jgi:hypothetical protein